MIPLLLLICGSAPDTPGVNLRVGNEHPHYLRIEVVEDGESPDRKWAAFLDALFDHFDRDGNGLLSPAEAARVIPLPASDGGEVKLDYQKLDANGDGQVTKEEFRELYRAAGFAPVVVVVRKPDPDVIRLSHSLFRHLDRDSDGIISTDEWKQAATLLRRLDENENEFLEPDEIVGADQGDVKLPTGSSVAVAEQPSSPIAKLRLELGESSSLQLANQITEIKLNDKQRHLDLPKARLRFTIPDNQVGSGFRLASEFYMAQFTEVLGKKPSLTKAELESDVSLQAVAAMFNAADLDGDGNLTANELAAFLNLIELGVSSQVFIVIEKRGQNLFDQLDTNSDGKLDTSELHRAKGLPELKREQIHSSYRIRVLRESVANSFGPVPLPKGKRASEKRTANSRTETPAWFRAMDLNGDGFVSATEFRGPAELFKKLDKNRDGRISVSEAEAAGR